jgi:hypothetical protein
MPELKHVNDWVAEDTALDDIADFVRKIEVSLQEMSAGIAEAVNSELGGKPFIKRQHVQALLGAVLRNPSVMLPEQRECVPVEKT